MKLKDGFPGQKMIVLPEAISRRYTASVPYSRLFVTDIGFYPQARYHYRERDKGIDQNILIYCIDGEGKLRTPHGKRTVRPGQWFIIPAGMPHRYSANKKKPWSIYWLHFTGTDAPFFIAAKGFERNPRPISVGDEPSRLKLFEEMFSALESGYSRENIGIVCTSLWRFLGSFVYSDRLQTLFTRQQVQPFNAIVDFMKNNSHKKLTLAELAKRTNYSVSHFSALFKKTIGYPPLDYLVHLRIQKACQLLDATTFQIKEIALRVGYEDPYFFSRIFKKTMGASPQHYRNKARG